MPRTAYDELARRDPRLPGMGTLLAPDAVLSLLDSLLPPGTERPLAVEVDSLRYRPGTGLDSGLILRYRDGTRSAFARALAPGPASPALAQEVRYARRWAPPPLERPVDVSALTEPRLRGPLHDPGLGVVLGPPADDRALAPVRHFAGAPHRFAAPEGGIVRTLAYRPGHRWTGRLDGPAGQPESVVRARSGGAAAAAYLAAAAAGVAVPDLVQVSRYGLLVTRWVPGEALEHRLGSERAAGYGTRVGEAGLLLARLHSVPPPRELAPGGVGGPAEAAAEIGVLLPDLAARAEAVALACRSALAERSGPVVLAHGDFRAGQVLAGAHGPALAHLDRAHAALPADDLANFAAAEYAAGRAGQDPAAALDPLLDGYAEGAPGPLVARVRRELGAATAAALLRRAVAPFRRGAPDWDARAADLIAAAERALRAG